MLYMSAQKYNVLSMYKKKFMQFKTNALSFSFFLAGVGQGKVWSNPARRAVPASVLLSAVRPAPVLVQFV